MSNTRPRYPSSGGSYIDDGKTLTRVTEPTVADPGKTARTAASPPPAKERAARTKAPKAAPSTPTVDENTHGPAAPADA
ncbi:hypothetical protein [Tahibacter soli]|uniref:Uncharacterized protein n=1 Tax=Tahibacter soli TaxID=2983605 RepID=A0A9X3YIE9_9GAMM|nr:hypothetical protein [Tahibacter soli]MDC8012939.1 hypothetical protein [Tahibacter soli]